ncbi:Protein N-methyltransferase NNT1 [Diplonema papillatum]|nr:Protein N-methyltransferase NNT1 [Diplonema papillatum]
MRSVGGSDCMSDEGDDETSSADGELAPLTFRFGRTRGHKALKLAESLGGRAYGSFVWAAAPVLACYVWAHLPDIAAEVLAGRDPSPPCARVATARCASKKRRITEEPSKSHTPPKDRQPVPGPISVVELGCGVGLVGLTASLRLQEMTALCPSSSVLLTDRGDELDWLRSCSWALSENEADLSQSDTSCAVLDWGNRGHVDEIFARNGGPVDVVLASDCLYDESVFDAFLFTLSLLLAGKPGCFALVSYQQRDGNQSLDFFFEKWRLTARALPVDPERLVASVMSSGKAPPDMDSVVLWRISRE